MPSPFPGMDPYLQFHWRDVHGKLITYAADELNTSLPTELVARTEERVYVESDVPIPRAVSPDVHVAERPSRRSTSRESDLEKSGVAVAEPVLITLQSGPVTEHFVQILDARGGRLVTGIEFLSPSNKVSGEGQNEYLRKQREFRAAGANLVEIDLVRGGEWVTVVRPSVFAPRLMTPYRVSVWRASRPGVGELYPVSLRDPLPKIRIPLRPTDPDVVLDLQSLFTRAYDRGRYEGTDYSSPCNPPLEGDDARWADELLRKAGLR